MLTFISLPSFALFELNKIAHENVKKTEDHVRKINI